MTPLYRFAQIVIPPVFSVLYPLECVHKPELPEEQHYILCANHLSMLDPIMLGRVTHRQIYFMAKAELFRFPPMAWLCRNLGGFPVRRGHRDLEAMQTARDILNRGDILGIFPEGTRSKTGELLPGKPGSVLFSAQTKAPILPVAFVPSRGKYRLFRRTLVVFGSLISPDELGVDPDSPTTARAATELLMARIAALQSEGRQLLHKKKEN